MSNATDAVWTLGALLDWTARHLAGKDVESPRLDAEVLLAHAVGCKRIDLYGLRFAEVATEDVKSKYRELIRRRLEGCPVAYLVGRKEFYGLDLKVSPAVLIPRPDSEHVVIEALAVLKAMPQPRLADIGTGSGNLAIAIARQHPGAHVTAIDSSAEALAIAQENAIKHGVAGRIRFVQSDLFSAFALARGASDDHHRTASLARPANELFDCIVSNPPYIADEDIAKLPIGVRQYEPLTGLQGGPGGFVVFDRLITESRAHLKPDGYLIIEIGCAQEQPARAQLAALPEFTLAPTIHDSSGHPRVLRAQFQRVKR